MIYTIISLYRSRPRRRHTRRHASVALLVNGSVGVILGHQQRSGGTLHSWTTREGTKKNECMNRATDKQSELLLSRTAILFHYGGRRGRKETPLRRRQRLRAEGGERSFCTAMNIRWTRVAEQATSECKGKG